MSKKNRQTKRKPKPLPMHLEARLDEAYDLMEQGEWLAARDILERLDRHQPRSIDVLQALIQVGLELHDAARVRSASERLLQLSPDDVPAWIALAGAYLISGHVASTLQTLEHLVACFPDAPDVDKARAGLDVLRTRAEQVLATAGLIGDDRFELARWHEEIQCCLDDGRWAEARRIAGQLLERAPHFVPGFNNLADAFFFDGEIEQAIATERRALEIAPDTIHALANLTRYLCVSGRLEDAQACAERLKQLPLAGLDSAVKKAEAFTCLGDDQSVLDTFETAKRDRLLSLPPGNGMLHHLAAVAACRQGNVKQARRWWKACLRLAPSLRQAAENLQDLELPAAEQNAPWPFNFEYWMPKKLLEHVSKSVRSDVRRGSAKSTELVERLLQKHPALGGLVPILLDRGDAAGRGFALQLAIFARTPEVVEALRGFALGRRGPDSLRTQAAQALREDNALPIGPTRMWIAGKWRDLFLFSWEIHNQPNPMHRPEVEQPARQAMEAIHADDGEEGERLLQQALALEPDAPDLLNNLAAAYGCQGRNAESEALIRQLFDRHPDYFFAQVGMANIYTHERRFEKAKELLDSAMQRPRLHVSELAALSMAQINLQLAENRPESAETWLSIWERIDPDHPRLQSCRLRVQAARGVKSWFPRLVKR